MAQHHDAAAIILSPQHLGGGKARRPAADNHDPAGRIDGALHLRPGLLTLFPNEDTAVLNLDLPDRDRTERRCPCGLAGAQIETGVMPGTPDALTRHETFGERPVIMAAMRAYRKNFGARTHQQHFVVANMAEQHLAREFG